MAEPLSPSVSVEHRRRFVGARRSRGTLTKGTAVVLTEIFLRSKKVFEGQKPETYNQKSEPLD